MRILVTGGAGFIGSHLCERLLARGDNVVCLDSLLTGRVQNLEAIARHPHFTLLQQDVAVPVQLQAERIFNLACPASPVLYQRDPVHTIRTCVLGAIAMLDLARANGARILQASTSEVYGDPEVHPQTEAYWGRVNPIGPRSCYDEGKRCAETLFFDYHRQYQTDIKVVRIFNTYGPRMRPDDGRVVSNFICQALRGQDITLFGDGHQTRSFCYVDDLLEGLLLAMDSPVGMSGPINLGNPVECSMLALAQQVLRLTRSRSRLVFLPLPQDDPRQRQPDITLAREQLGWQPATALEEGLERTIHYFRTQL